MSNSQSEIDVEKKSINKNVPSKSRRKRKRKSSHHCGGSKAKQTHRISPNSRQAVTMSSWAENFTVAATWQLKHQVAYWKARAVALEYENKVLHDIIREKHLVQPKNEASQSLASDGDADMDEPDEDDDLEVSEEYVQFLMQNAKYREDARKEREQLKAKQQAEVEAELNMEIIHETAEENQAKLTELYGDKWQRILALEMSVMCDFLHETDKEKPMYWPNIPFNFKSS